MIKHSTRSIISKFIVEIHIVDAMTIFRRLSTVAVVLSTLTLLLSVACTREVVKEVPVDRIVEVEVIKEVPVEKEVIKEIPVEKIIETTITEFVEKTVEVEVAVPVPAKGYVHQALEPFPKSGGVLTDSYTHLTLPTNREV